MEICEDRGIEKYGQIQEIAAKENIYAGLCNLFKHADDRYNSGLFILVTVRLFLVECRSRFDSEFIERRVGYH